MNKSSVSYLIRLFLLLVGLALPVGGLSLVGEALAQSGPNPGRTETSAGSAFDTGTGQKAVGADSLLPPRGPEPGSAQPPATSQNAGDIIPLSRPRGPEPDSALSPRAINAVGYINSSVGVDLDGSSILAWQADSSGNWEIYVMRWNGEDWLEIGAGSAYGGGISQNAGTSSVPSLAVGPDGKPIIAWEDNSSGDWEIYVKRWDGEAWVTLGAGSASGGGISKNDGVSGYPSLAIGPDGKPVVAWHDDSSGNWEIYVKRWNGSAWVEMGTGSAAGGGVSKNDGDSWYPSLAIGPDGKPVVAWQADSSGNAEIYLRRWNGSAWEEMAGSASGGGISQNAGYSADPSLAIGPDGAPVIAWDDSSSGNWEIYVKRWNGSAWVRMGANSAGGGGVSKNDGNSWHPSLAVAPDGLFALAWQDDSYDNWNIYMRLWNGAAWVEVYPGSATGSGHTGFLAGDSWYPSLAIGPNRLLGLAWQDNSDDYWMVWLHRRQIPQQIFHHFFAPSVLYVPPPPCFAGPDEVEPNNKAAEANGPLCRGVVYRGWPNDDRDYFMLETTTAGTIKVTVSNHFKEKTQLLLYRKRVDESPEAWDNKPDDGLQVELKNAQPDRYYIVIYSEKFNSTAPPYTMSVVFP